MAKNFTPDTRTAKASKSIYGSSWQLQQVIGGTFHYNNFDSKEELDCYCRENGVEYKVINQ